MYIDAAFGIGDTSMENNMTCVHAHTRAAANVNFLLDSGKYLARESSSRISIIMRDFFLSIFHFMLNSLGLEDAYTKLYTQFITHECELHVGRVIVCVVSKRMSNSSA